MAENLTVFVLRNVKAFTSTHHYQTARRLIFKQNNVNGTIHFQGRTQAKYKYFSEYF